MVGSWHPNGYAREVVVSDVFLQYFVDQIQEPHPEIRSLQASPGTKELALRSEDIAFIRAALDSRDKVEGAIVLRLGGQLSATQLPILLTAIASHLGPLLPELGTGGQICKVLQLVHPLGGQLTGNSVFDPHLNPYIGVPLHTDGAYHDPVPDWIGLGKLGEWPSGQGSTLLLNLRSWDDLALFLADARSSTPIIWKTPGAVHTDEIKILTDFNVKTNVMAPLFSIGPNGRPRIRMSAYCPGNINSLRASTIETVSLLATVSESLNSSQAIRQVQLDVGDLCLINNHEVLHGRAPFEYHPALYRRMIRVRGYFN